MKSTNPAVAQETVATRAYRLWEEAGKPEGQDQEFWFRAERELSASAGRQVNPGPIRTPPAHSRGNSRNRVAA